MTVLLDKMAQRGLVGAAAALPTARAGSAPDRQGPDAGAALHEVSLTMEDSLLQPLSPAERAMLREL